MDQPTREELVKFIWDELQEAIFDFNRYKRGDKSYEETSEVSCKRLGSFKFALECVLDKLGFNHSEEHSERGTILKYVITEPKIIFEYEDEDEE